MTRSRRLVLVAALGLSAGCAPAPPASSPVHVRAAHEAKLARAYGGWGAAAAVGGSGWLLGAGVLSWSGQSNNPRVRAALAFEGIVSPVLAVAGILSVLTSAILLRQAEEHDKAAAAIWGATSEVR
jgi:hypothetical protein